MNAVADDDLLSLADWRRTVARLYVDVRALAAVDPLTAWHHWIAERETLYRDHPQSPVPAHARVGFRADHFPYDPALRFDVIVRRDVPSDGRTPGLALPVSAGEPMSFRRIGRLDVPFAGGTRTLGLYWMAGYAGGLFLPFRDGTNNRETYGAGRYLLDAAKSADLGSGARPDSIVLDFNFAYQPSCAFDPKWACPLAPPENRLDLEIRAGERLT
jgi:uncharacterized protein (DUF1684 family)